MITEPATEVVNFRKDGTDRKAVAAFMENRVISHADGRKLDGPPEPGDYIVERK